MRDSLTRAILEKDFPGKVTLTGMNAEDDKALVARLLKGDEAAFERFFGDYFPRLFRFALTRLRMDEDSAEDVVQTTLMKAISKLDTYRGEASLFTWLCTFCRHEVSALFRKQGRAPWTDELTEDSPEVRSALESLAFLAGDDPEVRAQRSQLARLVQVTLDHLPRHYGDALEWKYIQGLSVVEIAERLDLGSKAAESLLTRARQAFRGGFAAVSGGRPHEVHGV